MLYINVLIVNSMEKKQQDSLRYGFMSFYFPVLPFRLVFIPFLFRFWQISKFRFLFFFFFRFCSTH